MKANIFHEKINGLINLLDPLKQNLVINILNKLELNQNLEIFEKDNLLLASFIKVSKFDVKTAINESYENEIKNLIINYDLSNLWQLVGVSFSEEIEIDDEYFIFGFLDSHLVYNSENYIDWVDEDDFTLLSKVAINDEIFLDCLYEYAENGITNKFTPEELLKIIVKISQTESIGFWAYLLGIDPEE